MSCSTAYLSIDCKFFKKAFILRTMKVTSKKQNGSFVENLAHKLNSWTLKSGAKIFKVLLATWLKKQMLQ